MTNPRHNFVRVTSRDPCPVCGKPDWCLVAKDHTAAICARVKSPRRVGKLDFAGCLHILRDDRTLPRRRVEMKAILSHPKCAIDWSALAHGCCAALSADTLARFASSLSLTAESLARLQVGWSAEHRAFTFPMADANGAVIGIRLRRANGFKFAVTGSHQGLFIPSDLIGVSLAAQRMFVAEGPTDCGALLDMNLVAIGRPSCTGGVALLASYVRMMQPWEVVIIADRDKPGQDGAAHLADVLAAHAPTVRIVTPPAKDAREWLRLGATPGDALAALNAAPAHKLKITVRLHGAIT